MVHADQRRTDVTTQVVPGGTVTERWVPVDRVGLYVPGGLAPLPVQRGDERRARAGRRRRVARRRLARRSGTTAACPHPGVLAACALLGVDEVYAVGGAQAVAMFAYGAEVLRAGRPGHRARATSTSTAAKRLLQAA